MLIKKSFLDGILLLDFKNNYGFYIIIGLLKFD